MLLSIALGSSASTAGTDGSTSPAGGPNTDKLAQILAWGTLLGKFEPEYPPQSMAVERAMDRLWMTQPYCIPGSEITSTAEDPAGEAVAYDIDTLGQEI